MPVPVLLRAIDALAYSKFNTFHCKIYKFNPILTHYVGHAVDAESFPIESATYPELSKGAFSSYETYSTQDIQNVVQVIQYSNFKI